MCTRFGQLILIVRPHESEHFASDVSGAMPLACGGAKWEDQTLSERNQSGPG